MLIKINSIVYCTWLLSQILLFCVDENSPLISFGGAGLLMIHGYLTRKNLAHPDGWG